MTMFRPLRSMVRYGARCAAVWAALFAALFGGCARPTYAFDPRPTLTPARSAAETCYQERRVELAAGRVFWARHQPGYAPDTMVSTYFTDGGLVLYRGGQRFDARASLRQIGEAELTRDYESILSLTARDYEMYPIYRNATIGLGVVGSAAVAVGSIWLVAEAGKENASNTPAYMMIGGLVIAGLSLVPALLAYRSIDGNILHERRLKMFTDENFAPKLVAGARRHNQRVAADCRVTDADLPMTPNARAAIGER